MSEPIIRVESLGKKYLIRHQEGRASYRALRDVLADGVRSAAGLFRDRRPPVVSREEFWALRDVSFDVREGEVVGIIGRNGAGKSTLLKILSRITEPTAGSVTLNGRVASLLEVGTGFHPELTGRENIYLNGSILGMRRKEIERKFDAIVAFAEVEQFLDTPVKRYSSGMYVRLAFAVAAHLEPEILIVDEVLAVGDAAFQRKCLGKMDEVARGGRTVLFVSHNMTVVQNLCQRAVLLRGGRVQFDGAGEEAVRLYLKHADELVAEWTDDRPARAGPEDRVRFTGVRVRNAADEVTARLSPREPFSIEVDYRVLRRATCQVAFRLNTEDGTTVLTTGDGDAQFLYTRTRELGAYRAAVAFPAHLLAPGRYHLLLAANQPGGPAYDLLEQVLYFEVDASGSLKQIEGRYGVVAPLLAWREQRLAAPLSDPAPAGRCE